MKLMLILSFTICIGIAVGRISTARPNTQLLGAKECTWGPSYWCQNLTTSSACRATKHCIQTTWMYQKLAPDLTSVCQTCLEMVKEARDQLLSNETQEEIKEVFEGSCKLLPVKVVAKECCKLADQFIPDLVDTLASQMDPQVVCSVAGLCNNERVHQLLQSEDSAIAKIKPADYDTCGNCEKVINIVDTKFRSATPEEIKMKYLQLCRQMGSFSDGCQNIILTYFDNIYEHISNNLNSKDFCIMAGECSANFHSHADVKVIPLSRVGVVPVGPPDLPCDLCTQLVKHLKEILIANTTEEEFRLVLNGICKQTKSFKDECLQLVNNYYSEAYKFLAQELNGTVLCSLIDICPGPGLLDEGPIQPLLPIQTIQNHQLLEAPIVPIDRTNANKGSPLEIIESPELAQLPIERIVPQTLTIIGNTQLCEFCEYFLHFVQQALTDPKTDDQIRRIVDKACDKLPSAINDTCRQFVDTYGPAFIAILAQDIDPSVVCPTLSLCPSQEVSNVEIFMNHNQESKPNCPLCLFAISSLEEYIKNKKTEENIRKELNFLCSHLRSSVKEECVDFVNTYTEEIVEACLADLDPAEVCEYLKLCKDKTPVKKFKVEVDYPSKGLFERVNPEIVENIEKAVPKIEYEGEIETNEIPDFTSNGKVISPTITSQACVLCEFVMSQIKKELKDNSTEDEIKNIVHGVCNYLPATVKKECNDFVSQYADAVIELLIQSLEPNEICAELKFCKPTQPINANSILGNVHSPQCAFCKIVMDQIEHMLQGKITEDEVLKAVRDVCHYMPAHQSAECKEFIDTNGKRIIQLLEVAIKPAEICSLMFFCTNHFKTLTLEIRKCTVCETAINIIKQMLSNPNVDHDVGHVLEKTCRAVSPKYRNLCRRIIDVYGVKMYETLVEGADPRIVCNSLGLCGSQVAFPVNLVGTNECTWGPAYWCANKRNANKCKALQHCQEIVWTSNPLK